MKNRIYRHGDAHWRGHRLVLCSGRTLATVERDNEYTALYRARLRNGFVSGILNLTRAKDAAIALALAELNQTLEVA
jgi:hypothetical protein